MAAPTTPIDWSTFSGFNGSLKRATLVDDSPILDPGQPVHESGDNKSVNVGRDVLKVRICYYYCDVLISLVSVESLDQQIAGRGCYRETSDFRPISKRCKVGHR